MLIYLHSTFCIFFSDNTIRIDKRLGFFQSSYNLTGKEVREVATKQPRLITYNLHHITTNTFVIKEEMGFTEEQMKDIIKNKPKLLMLNQKSLLERFNYIHNIIKIPHEMILKNLNILEYRNFIVKQRHLFLKKLGRAQYNPTQANYVPITALCVDTDVEFCKKYAKSNVDDFNTFLKTL
ncbi:transcription termination factor 3, mitochondrial isoform X2 [Zerene cesonia]|uniref:transcription termination factor 3, mitochondrial isoform X2 n=1 Tax=Zerene cesonia TaxID=33412 RepID=UPI0018E582C1|nr:transcription termination factor 3, mitochondrial isoform X2 [Zerene cesonia]